MDFKCSDPMKCHSRCETTIIELLFNFVMYTGISSLNYRLMAYLYEALSSLETHC